MIKVIKYLWWISYFGSKIKVFIKIVDEVLSTNVIKSLMQDTTNSWRSQQQDHSLDTSENMTDYAMHSANSQDNTCGNNSPLSSEDEQQKDFVLNEIKQGK